MTKRQIQDYLQDILDAVAAIEPQPCFASLKAKRDYDEQIWFTRIRSFVCKPYPINN